MAQLTRSQPFPPGMTWTGAGYGRGHARPRSKGWAAVGVGLGVLAGSSLLMLKGVEPFASLFYEIAWYATLLALYGALALSAGRSPRLRSPASLLTMLAWSAVLWMFFEMLNLRLRNWYYVFLPTDMAVRWFTNLLSFATVLPAIFGAEALLEARNVFERVRWRPLRVTPALLTRLRLAGVGMLLLPMIWPHYFFPLVWGTTTFVLEPAVYRRDRSRSLLADLEQGRPGRLLRLLLGGAAIGFLWELFNIAARAKWIYTVPFFEHIKLFEMPVLGFFGFPPFAVDCFVIWQLLVLAGVAVPLNERVRPARWRRRLGVALAAVAFTLAVAVGMERRTIASLRPSLGALPEVPAARLEQAGYDAFSLAQARPQDVAERLDAGVAQAARWVEVAQLATLRGIGDANVRWLEAVGIRDVGALASVDPATLAARLRRAGRNGVVDARIRVWVRAARRLEAAGSTQRVPRTSIVPASPSRSSPTSAAAGV